MPLGSKLTKRSKLAIGASCLALALGSAQAVSAQTVVYENLPTNLAIPPNISWHNATGPIIADDFIPIQGGQISHVTWWGSEAFDLNFEVVLQDNNPLLGEPALTPTGNITTGGLKQIVTATSSAYAIPGIFQFDADIAPGWNIGAGTDYWFTAANVQGNWQWAEALAGPSVGSEMYNAHSSTGGVCLDGGPHCGPWTDRHTDFAFKITAVPEPSTWAMMIVGFGGAGVLLRRRRTPGLQSAG